MGISFFCMCFCVPCCGTGMVQGVLLSCHASFHSDGCALHPACSYVLLFACTLLLVSISFYRDGWIALPSLRFPWSGGGGPPTLFDPTSPSTKKTKNHNQRTQTPTTRFTTKAQGEGPGETKEETRPHQVWLRFHSFHVPWCTTTHHHLRMAWTCRTTRS